MEFKDSGTRSNFGTGAVRDGQQGKGRMDLMPVRALIEVSKIMETGARKYAARNWEAGIPLSRFMDSGLRHALKCLRGDRDEPHLAMACWNFLCLLDTQARIEEGLLPTTLNDLPCNPLTVKDNPLGIQATDCMDLARQFLQRHAPEALAKDADRTCDKDGSASQSVPASPALIEKFHSGSLGTQYEGCNRLDGHNV